MEQTLQIVYIASFYSTPFPQNYSLITTVVIAVVRCCCVAMPLKVKFVLTAGRQLSAILLLSGIATSVLLYVTAPLNIYYVENPVANATEAYFRGARWSVYSVFNNIVSFGGFIICIACVIILSTSLSKASRFRISKTVETSNTNWETIGKSSVRDAKSKERQKTTRVVRTVLLVSVIFIVCNVPNIALYLLKASVEGFGATGKYKNSNRLGIIVAEVFLLISGCLNTIIYVFCNSRYQGIFLAVFGTIKASK